MMKLGAAEFQENAEPLSSAGLVIQAAVVNCLREVEAMWKRLNHTALALQHILLSWQTIGVLAVASHSCCLENLLQCISSQHCSSLPHLRSTPGSTLPVDSVLHALARLVYVREVETLGGTKAPLPSTSSSTAAASAKEKDSSKIQATAAAAAAAAPSSSMGTPLSEITQGSTPHVSLLPPPPGHTELPTCPVCLERLDEHISGVVTTVRGPKRCWRL
jgi:hypothetical protein